MPANAFVKAPLPDPVGIRHMQTKKFLPSRYNGALFPYNAFLVWTPIMLAKLTSKNQLTLPKAVIAAVETTDYFDVTTEDGRIVLTPVRVNRADGVRAKLAKLGLSDSDVKDAVAWARSGD